MTTATPINPAQFFADWEFVNGVGNYAKHQACVMSAIVALERAEAGVDLNGAINQVGCVCPVLQILATRRNDIRQSAAERKAWALAMIPRLIGTNDGLSQQRAYICADYACRVIVPKILDRGGYKDRAVAARALAPVVDAETAKAAQKILRNDAADGVYAAVAALAAAVSKHHLDEMLKRCLAIKERR